LESHCNILDALLCFDPGCTDTCIYSSDRNQRERERIERERAREIMKERYSGFRPPTVMKHSEECGELMCVGGGGNFHDSRWF
jgi:hypothetical protein